MIGNLTNFPGGITSYGVPVIGGGQIPAFLNGKYYFVDGTYGSDSYSGESPDAAFATIGQAITVVRARITNWARARWAQNDVIVIAPGSYDENLILGAHGVTFVGLGHDNRDAQCGVKIKPTTGSPFSVSGLINTAFYNIGFEAVSTSKAFSALVCNNCLFVNCRFSGPAETVTCAAAFYTNDATCTKLINCDFTCAAIA